MDEEHYYTTLDLYNVARQKLASEKMLTAHLIRTISQLYSAYLGKNEDALREGFQDWEDWNVWLSQLRVWEHQEKQARKKFLKNWLEAREKIKAEESDTEEAQQ